MPDLKDLRALIKDHQEKDSGLTLDAELCLKTWLVQELHDMEAEKVTQQRESEGSMADADTTEMDAAIEAKQAEIEEATILLHFKALPEPKYRDVMRESPNVSPDSTDADDATFLANLADACYRGVNWGGQEFTATEMPMAEIRDSVSFGELDAIQGLVYGLNRRKIDRPFSSKPSRGNRRT